MKNNNAEGILDKYYQPKMHWMAVNRSKVVEAMQEYASLLLAEKEKEIDGLKDEIFSLTVRLNSLGHLNNALNQELEQLKRS